MQIERRKVERVSIGAFADKHELIMQVVERRGGDYYAHFKDAETKDGCILAGTYGNGATEEDAIANYAEEISQKLLVIGAYTQHRREIWVPKLYAANNREDGK